MEPFKRINMLKDQGTMHCHVIFNLTWTVTVFYQCNHFSTSLRVVLIRRNNITAKLKHQPIIACKILMRSHVNIAEILNPYLTKYIHCSFSGEQGLKKLLRSLLTIPHCCGEVWTFHPGLGAARNILGTKALAPTTNKWPPRIRLWISCWQHTRALYIQPFWWDCCFIGGKTIQFFKVHWQREWNYWKKFKKKTGKM